MQFRPRVAAVVAGTACAAGLFAVPHALGGSRVELLQCLDHIPTLVGTRGPDVLTGTVGDDVIAGLGGDDVLLGSWGHDVICGGDGDDRITGGVGLFESDVISGDEGDDHIAVGGSPSVLVYAFAPGPVRVDLKAGTATGWGRDTLVAISNVVGSDFADLLQGSDEYDCFDGLGGDDVILSLGGDDCLYGGNGDDSLDGGPGLDLLSYRYSTAPVRVNLARGTATGEGTDRVAAVEEVVGSSFGDVLTGDGGTNSFRGEGGADRLAGGAGTDRLDGGSGRDRVDGGIGRDNCLNAERRLRCP
jgi:Ca2+-binding RTX toxin-like protein